MTIAKCDEQELDAVMEYLQDLKQVIEDNENYDEDDQDVNQEIADVARKYPGRAFIVPLNLRVLLDTYQDPEPDILQHPKWILALQGQHSDMKGLLEDMDRHLDTAGTITDTGKFGTRIKEVLKGI